MQCGYNLPRLCQAMLRSADASNVAPGSQPALNLTVAKTLYHATGDLEQALAPMIAALADKDAKVR